MKICSKCKINKSLSEFTKFSSCCKECKKKYDEIYREKNKDKRKLQHRADYLKNYDRYSKLMKEYRDKDENKQKHLEYCRKPEYKKYKTDYDQIHLAKKTYGEYWECSILIEKIQNIVIEKIPDKYERLKMRGVIDRLVAKSMLRKSIKTGRNLNQKWKDILFLQDSCL